MENISYVGLSQALSLQRQMDVTANNIANMNTTGYKSKGIMFLEYLNNTKSEDGPLKQVQDFGTYRDLAPGSMSQTHNALDFAIQGEGYFTVSTKDGTRYTRDGGFSLNTNRELVTKDGQQVQGDGGPITIPAEATRIIMSADGTISTDQGTLGKLKIVTFDNEQKLVNVGNNYLDAKNQPEKPVEKPHVEQGMVEASNVNPIIEMNRMIQIQRAYESVQRMLSNDHDRQRTAIQKLTKV